MSSLKSSCAKSARSGRKIWSLKAGDDQRTAFVISNMNPNDYDEDGNNIVPCPICLSNYCPSKEDGTCPEEADFVKWHTQKENDIVYILGSGSKWDDNELRYSLRSVEKYFPHRKVFIVGERPDWLQNIIHLKVPDGFANVNGGKFKNVIRKTIAACVHEDVSDNFVLMNDDFFFLDYCNEIKMYSMGTLQQQIEKYGPNERNQYRNALIRTMRFLAKKGIENPLSYAVHYPISYNKSGFLAMMTNIDWLEASYSWRSIYGNLFNTEVIERADTKVSSPEALEAFLEREDKGDFLSISDNVALDPRFQKWIQEQFPEPSFYEKQLHE